MDCPKTRSHDQKTRLFDESILALDTLLHAVHALQLTQDVGYRKDLHCAAAQISQAPLVPLHIVAAVVLHILCSALGLWRALRSDGLLGSLFIASLSTS